jgi:hypothetical protein
MLMTKARQLIDGASYGPETVKAMGQAFDEAWLTIASTFGSDPQDIEKARMRLARAVLSVADEDSRDVQALKVGALEAMALAYREKYDRD